MTGFIALAFGLSWACWLPLALSATGAAGTAGSILLHAGEFGPLLATLIVLARDGMRAERAAWWRRLSSVRALASPAGALCVLAPLLVLQLSLRSYPASGGIVLPGPQWSGSTMTLLLPALLLVALPQELAWRGYALPVLIRGRDPVAPTLLLGLCWGLWHLPLFFIKGTYYAGIEPFSATGLLFLATVMAQSMLMTAFYLATRCTWAAVLFHGMTNIAGEVWQLPVEAEIHRSLWTVLLALAVLQLKPPFGVNTREPADAGQADPP